VAPETQRINTTAAAAEASGKKKYRAPETLTNCFLSILNQTY
jgi:hypothetical protein